MSASDAKTPRPIVLGGRTIAKGTAPFILAEMACAHDGSVERALQMVNDAADGGAEGMQFQLFSTDQLLTPRHKFYAKVKSLEIAYADWREIFDAARGRGLKIFVNPLSVDALDAVKTLGADVLKIHSADLSNPDMVKGLVSFRLPVSVSCGGSTQEEIRGALDLLMSHGIQDIILMHGFQAYPTLLEHSHLNYIATLEKAFGLCVGYQDHIDGADEMARILPAIAVAAGAVLLEKHVTDSRARKGTDFQSALDRDGFAHFVRVAKSAYASLGSATKGELSQAELDYRKTFKKSLVAARDIAKGEVFSQGMVLAMRGDDLGLTPKEWPQLMTKPALKALKKFDVIKKEDVFESNEVR